MLKMIIADDEFIVRDGLMNIINWEEFGIEIIAAAVDGQEAYELCQKFQPDILFTDIRMPLMDGLEVAMKLKEQESDIKIIIISGVQDFNYAKTALNVNAEGYILKPVKIGELKEVVKKVADNINMERNKIKEIEQLRQQLHENLPVIREKFLRNLVHGVFRDEQEIEKKLEFININLQPNDIFIVSVLQVDSYNQITENHSEEDKQLLSFSISNIIDEIMSNYNSGVSFCLSENEFVMIFNQNICVMEKCTQTCEEIISCLNKFLKVSASIGIGPAVKNFLQANISYKGACMALSYGFYTGKNSILNINDINSICDVRSDWESVGVYNLYESENKLMSYMKLGDRDGASNVINEIFSHLSSGKNLPIGYVQSICVEMIGIASRALFELGESIEDIVSDHFSILNTIYCIENVFDLHNNMFSVFTKISDYFSKKHNQKNSKIIGKIKEIIETRYMKDISVAKISEEVYLTPNYISLIFKQGTGETIVEYITKTRMEAAKELLKTTDFKILEIADMVGYENPRYFSTVFKKYTGIHPQKFRVCSTN